MFVIASLCSFYGLHEWIGLPIQRALICFSNNSTPTTMAAYLYKHGRPLAAHAYSLNDKHSLGIYVTYLALWECSIPVSSIETQAQESILLLL